MVGVEELECGCCYELMVNPTTLTCGHSFCRYCLAKWSSMSKKTECPECRQTWTGFPQINVHLRTIVEKSVPKEYSSRKESQMSLPDYQEIVTKFEAHGKGKGGGQPIVNIDIQNNMQAIIGVAFLAIAVILGVALVAFLYSFSFSGPQVDEVIYFKPVHRWTILEVATWAQKLTAQLGHDYSESFDKAGIDGQLLLSLTDEDLASPPLDIYRALHRKIFIGEITRLNLTKVKQPQDLWEYKTAHRTNALFLLFMLQDSPRLTFAYLHYMEYHTIFLPFLRSVTDKEDCDPIMEDEDDTTCSTIEDNNIAGERGRFYLKVVLFPYYLIAQFAWRYIDVHFVTMWIVISHSVMLTFGELSRLSRLPRVGDLPRKCVDCLVSFIITCIWYWSLLSVTPAFVLDIVFYGKLYYGPFDTANSIRNGNLRANVVGKILNGVAATGQSIWRIFRFLANPRN